MTRYDKIARMKPEQKNHWIDIPELSPWGERVFAEIAVADEISKHENGRYDSLLDQAVDCLYSAFVAQHALPDDTCRQAEEILLPLSKTAKSMTLHCVAHAHIDMDWMWGFHETVDVTHEHLPHHAGHDGGVSGLYLLPVPGGHLPRGRNL